MKIALLVCLFLAVASAQQYFSLQVQGGKAISLGNAGTHAYLKLATYNALDATQHWMLESAGASLGFYVVSRQYPLLNFDISGDLIAANTRIAAWERKSGARNQRFNWNSTTGMLTPATNTNLFVTANAAGIVQLATKTASSVGLTSIAAPAAYVIRVIGSTQPINITFTNAPIPNWIIPANAPFRELSILAGAILVAKNSDGIVLEPTSYTVTSNATVTFAAPRPPAPVGSCRTIVNPADGNTWKLDSIPGVELWSDDWYFYTVNFCGTSCYDDGDSAGCQDEFRGLGKVSTATFTSFSAGQIKILATGGYVDWGCTDPRQSEFVLNCRTDDSTEITTTVSGGCGYTFTMDIPKQYCTKP